MPRKTRPDKPERRDSRGRTSSYESRTPRPKPKVDFTVDALDFNSLVLNWQYGVGQTSGAGAASPSIAADLHPFPEFGSQS